MNKQAKPDQKKHPHNKKVESTKSTERFTDAERKEKESKQRSIGGF